MTEFKNWCKARNITITDNQLQKFAAYKQNLLDWNAKINLTAITDDTGIWQKHFADSLTTLETIDQFRPGSLVDVGTGAGLPGIPIKIMRPEIRVTLLDSTRKRCVFLEDTIKKLQLTEIEVHHCRAEDFLRHGGKKHDICTARAVAKLDKLTGWCMPLVKPGGIFLAMKGSDISEELANAQPAIKKAAARLHSVKNFELVEGMQRTLVLIQWAQSPESP